MLFLVRFCSETEHHPPLLSLEACFNQKSQSDGGLVNLKFKCPVELWEKGFARI